MSDQVQKLPLKTDTGILWPFLTGYLTYIVEIDTE